MIHEIDTGSGRSHIDITKIVAITHCNDGSGWNIHMTNMEIFTVHPSRSKEINTLLNIWGRSLVFGKKPHEEV